MSLLDSISQRSGNIQKAVIEIIDLRGREVVVEPPVEVQGGGLAGKQSSLPSLKASETFAGASVMAGTLAKAEEKAGLMVSYNPAAPLLNVEGATRKLFYVQFNPNEVSLSGYADRPVKKMDFSKEGSAPEVVTANPRITMNVKLIFDKTDPQDAFMGDKLNMSASSIATGAVKAGRSLAGKKDNSVQAEVEGLIAALRSKYTRRITFYWGTMSYTGILNRVSAEYTMFNVLGLPIRAYVNLSLTCADDAVLPGSMGSWQDHYEELFAAKDLSYVKAAQKAGNWFNVNV